MSGILVESKVSTAVGALLQISQKTNKTDKLIEDADVVHMQICLKKIPPKDKTVKLKLPHPIRRPDLEVCLFVKDLDKDDRDYEPTVHHFQDLFRKRGITSVTDIIPLKSLKTEYKPYEAKRNLSNAYDIFLADARIVRLLPTYLGKYFYGRKKTPVQVNLQTKDLAKEINSAISNSRCVISSKGSSSLAVIGTVHMSQEELTGNVIASANQIAANVAGGSNNIKQLSLKSQRSVSIPIYMCGGGPQDVTIPKEERPEPVEAEEITTLFDAKVKVYPSGHIKVIRDGESEEPQRKRKRTPNKKSKSKLSKKQQQKRKGSKSPKVAKTKQTKKLTNK